MEGKIITMTIKEGEMKEETTEEADQRKDKHQEKDNHQEKDEHQEKDKHQEKKKQDNDRIRSTSKESFKGRFQQNGCWKCGDESHQMAKCKRYPFYCEQKCDFCNLMHPTSFCRFRRSRYITPPTSREDSRTRSRETSPSRQNYFLQ